MSHGKYTSYKFSTNLLGCTFHNNTKCAHCVQNLFLHLPSSAPINLIINVQCYCSYIILLKLAPSLKGDEVITFICSFIRDVMQHHFGHSDSLHIYETGY